MDTDTLFNLALTILLPRLPLLLLLRCKTQLTPQTLTVCYHISHQRINIRKETSTSVNVFSIASYLSMVALLAHMLASQPDYPTMPVVAHGKRLYADARHLVSQIKGTIERERAEL